MEKAWQELRSTKQIEELWKYENVHSRSVELKSIMPNPKFSPAFGCRSQRKGPWGARRKTY